MNFRSALIILTVVVCGCDESANDVGIVPFKDSVATKQVPVENARPQIGDNEGFAGVFDVPEMLCISKIDSGAIRDVSAKVSKNFVTIAGEMERIGAVQGGPAGQINYNNDPGNFKFECLILIKSVPRQQPRNCNIVVLEASKMLIYNYYGPYTELYTAYKHIGDYCKQHKLEQTGPQREFYVTDPTAENDANKWLTRIMLPVNKKP